MDKKVKATVNRLRRSLQKLAANEITVAQYAKAHDNASRAVNRACLPVEEANAAHDAVNAVHSGFQAAVDRAYEVRRAARQAEMAALRAEARSPRGVYETELALTRATR